MDYYSLFWRPKAISMVVEPQGALTCRSSAVAVLADSGPFLGLLLSFGAPKWFLRLTNPGVRLRVHHQHSQFWPILTRFVDYYAPFWGSKAISIVVEPQGALSCRSSTHTDLADSGPFLRLLLTILGSRSDFHDWRTPGCVYVSVINTRSFGRFWPVSWTITHCFGVQEWFPRLTNIGVRLRVGH